MEMALRPMVVFGLFTPHSPPTNGNAMRQFIEQFDDRLLGVLSGFDRLRFRGTLLLLSSEGGMNEFLWRNQILLKDWDDFVGPLTERVRRSGERLAAKTPTGRVRYYRPRGSAKRSPCRICCERSRSATGGWRC